MKASSIERMVRRIDSLEKQNIELNILIDMIKKERDKYLLDSVSTSFERERKLAAFEGRQKRAFLYLQNQKLPCLRKLKSINQITRIFMDEDFCDIQECKFMNKC